MRTASHTAGTTQRCCCFFAAGSLPLPPFVARPSDDNNDDIIIMECCPSRGSVWPRPSVSSLLVGLVALAASSMFGTAVAASSPSHGCGSAAPAALSTMTEVNLTLSTAMGGDRHYFYWLPPSYNASLPSPLVLSFHGSGSSAALQASVDYFTIPDFNPKSSYVVVYPEATFEDGTTQRMWQIAPEMAAQGIDDVGYVLAILDDVRSHICIDNARIYASGMSQGGGMTNLLACSPDTAAIFAAYAPVAGAYYYPYPNPATNSCRPTTDKLPCDPGRADIPILAFHGGDDIVIDYEGGDRRGACTPDIPYWAEQWALRDGLDTLDMGTYTSASAIEGSLGSVIEKLGGSAERYTYGSGTTAGLVQLVFAGKNVGHVWPADFFRISQSSGQAVGTGTTQFNASSLIMDFFGRYTLPDRLLPPSPTPSPTNAAMRVVGHQYSILGFLSLAIALLSHVL
ncbi:Alpha/Beta hydrolase protein [Microdochium trichocladiopsis]|uniref:feruloyl esterase n=1 Tax=Microdochium trichocladiopsis TaxID=1682393 RepID=A0A9P9BR94_9PEZI|nr:Alpha/Beta hydrolase protein [Microdochium trichocladiopsis]KAH7032651.1 Alpha/Beta hydrolase protein [Microdochium trichocladiopsis]